MNKRLITAILLGAFAWRAHAVDATDVMKNFEQLVRVRGLTVSVKMTIGAKGKVEKTKYFDSWRKLTSDNIHYNTLTRVTKPADLKGEAVMMQEFANNQNNIFVYLPAFRKTRRVEGSDQSKSFMGTVFSYSDITTFHYVDYKFRLTKTEKCEVSAGDCHVIEAVPRTDDMKKRTHYSKSVYWVGVTDGLVHKTDTYDLDGKLTKHILLPAYRKVRDGKWVVMKIDGTRVEDGKTSSLVYGEPDVDTDIDDSLFTEEGMSTAS